MLGIIYETRNKANGKIYRGQHICEECFGGGDCGYRGSGVAINRAIKKYGIENFQRITLARALTQKNLNRFEEYYVPMEFVEQTDTYNLQTGGGEQGIPSEESRKKMSESSKGKVVSAETRRKIGLASRGRRPCLGRKASPETRAKMSASHVGYKGKKHTAETRRKIGLASKGRQTRLGIKHTDETRAKISANHKGMKGLKHTAETRIKMSRTRKEFWRRTKLESGMRADFLRESNFQCQP